MSMIPYDRRDPVAFGQEGLYQATIPDPSLGAVIDAFVQETYFGVGSGYADTVDYNYEQAKVTGTPIDEESFKRYYGNSGVGYKPGMTAEAAQILVDYDNERRQNQETIAAASSGDYFAGAAIGFGAGIFEPKNLAYGAAAIPVTGAVAPLIPLARSYRSVMQLRRAGLAAQLSARQYGALAAGGAVDGMVGAAMMEPSNRDTADTLQQDYTMADTMWNVGLSTVLGAGLSTAPRYAVDKYSRWKGRTEEIVSHEIDLATEQLVTGQKVDVSHVERVAIGELSTKPVAEKAAAVEQFVRYTDTPEFKARFEGSKVVDETGAPLRVYHGTNKNFTYFAISKASDRSVKSLGEGFFFSPDADFAAAYAQGKVPGNIIAEGANIRPAYLNIKKPLIIDMRQIPRSKSAADYLNEKYTGNVLPRAKASDLTNNMIKDGYDGLIIKDMTGKLTEVSAFSPDQIISAFGADDMDAIAKRIDSENQAALSKATTDSLSPYASTAIDKADIDTLNTQTESLPDVPDYAKQYDSNIEKMRAMVDEGAMSKDEFDSFMDIMDNNNEADTLEALKDLETCLAGLV